MTLGTRARAARAVARAASRRGFARSTEASTTPSSTESRGAGAGACAAPRDAAASMATPARETRDEPRATPRRVTEVDEMHGPSSEPDWCGGRRTPGPLARGCASRRGAQAARVIRSGSGRWNSRREHRREEGPPAEAENRPGPGGRGQKAGRAPPGGRGRDTENRNSPPRRGMIAARTTSRSRRLRRHSMRWPMGSGAARRHRRPATPSIRLHRKRATQGRSTGARTASTRQRPPRAEARGVKCGVVSTQCHSARRLLSNR